MKKLTKGLLLSLALASPLAAQAHNFWLMPSQTVLSGDSDNWITVDAAVSNDLFYFNHVPLNIAGLTISAPDGQAVAAVNQHKGKLRSSFDVHLEKEGTYKLAVVNNGIFARYELDGETKRLRGSLADIETLPAKAKKVEITESQSRVETFATVGAPSKTALAPTGKGLELEAVTHPNDLYATEKADFRLLLDGKPAKNIKVVIIRGDTRYRDNLNEIELTTDKNGAFSVTWPDAGMYWLEASVADKNTSVKKAKTRRAVYVATFEVLPQ